MAFSRVVGHCLIAGFNNIRMGFELNVLLALVTGVAIATAFAASHACVSGRTLVMPPASQFSHIDKGALRVTMAGSIGSL